MSTRIARRLALMLGAAAAWLMPASRDEWRHTMRSDLRHIACNRAALRWACGCIWFSIYERVKSMIPLQHETSRSLLIAAMVLCYVPLSLASLAFVTDWVIAPSGSVLFAFIALLSLFGPIGLVATISLILRRHSLSWSLGVVLVLAPLLLSIGIFVAFGRSEITALSTLRDIVLIGVLPALAGIQLFRIGRLTSTFPLTR